MKRKKMLSALLVVAMAATMFAGCGNKGGSNSSTQGGKAANGGDIKEFTAFFAVPGSEINDDNEIQQIIAEKTGVKGKETWLTGQTAEEAIGTLVAGDEYPDFICGGNGMPQLYDAGALVALDDYIDKYPNIKNYFTEQEWDQLRQDDGHIYWIPQFSNIKGEEKTCTHNDEAFWIQARVLEWANYPEIKTMDDYFKLIEDYNAANPTMEDGTENIPYTILCEDWRYFCLENAPQFLDGYPNDGSCMVDPDTLKVMDYNTSDTAVKYFKKLNEEYQKGIVDPESFTQTYDEYIAKLSSGRVLGMIDQWWDFAYTAGDAIKSAGLDAQGCDYIPVPVTIDGRKNQWHNSGGVLNSGDGLAITKDCDDVEAALQFVDDLLSEEIHNLRFWGVEGEDYQVGDDGLFYRICHHFTKKLCKFCSVLCLFISSFFIIHSDLRISLTVGNSCHSQIHTNFRALSLEICAKICKNVFTHAFCNTNYMFGSPGHFTLLLYELLCRCMADRALCRCSLTFINITTYGTYKLCHFKCPPYYKFN